MVLLIRENRKGIRYYSEFASEEEVERYLQVGFRKWVCVENKNESEQELVTRITEVCVANSLPGHPHLRVIFEPSKAGSHIIAYNVNGLVEVLYSFFMCDSEAFSGEELSRMTRDA